MEVKTDVVAFDRNVTLDDLFQAYAIRSMPDASPERYQITKNAFYMGVNATMSMLSMSRSDEEFTTCFETIEKAFEMYNSELMSSH